MNEALCQYDDMYSGLNDDILKNMFIRYYTMEDFFDFTSNQLIEADHSKNAMEPQAQPQPKKIHSVAFIFNRIIQQCICDVYVMNKLICTKAKTVNALLDNGRNIASKKSSSWSQFINQNGFQKVKIAYELLSPIKKNIIKYSVLSISNLQLKLSINMSKISIIPLQKFLNFQCLNIPVLSLIFLQYLQYKLFKSKNLTDQQQQLNFMRQFPKVTFIKINLNKNNTELQMIQNSQQEFITKQVGGQPVRNIQFIQINQRSYDPIMPKYERKTKYQCIHNFDLQKISKGTLKSPFSFELLQLMRLSVFPLVKDFKPDLIIFMESYPSGHAVMNDQMRGLMICQMAQQTCCNKMYVFKQMGMNKLDIKQYKQLNKFGQQLTKQNAKIFQDEETKIYNRLGKKLFIKNEDLKMLQKIKKVFENQICYTSLALIQKTSFDNALEASNKHLLELQFLYGLMQRQIELISSFNKQINDNLVKKLQCTKGYIQNMITASEKQKKGVQNTNILKLFQKQNKYTQFFNLQKQTMQILKTKQETKYFFTDSDNFIVKYYDQQQRLLAIIIKYVGVNQMTQTQLMQITVLSKSFDSEHMKQQAQFYVNADQNYLEGATYVCSNEYLYRGFGKFKINKPNPKTGQIDPQGSYNKSIHRLRICPHIGNQWEPLDATGTTVKQDGKEQPKTQLQKKVYGYGIFDIDNKTIFMMGGYIDSYNEQKVSKKIYLIKGADNINGKQANKKIIIIGKTNRIVFSGAQNIKNLFLHPFVFGIPFFIQKGNAYALNSNGGYLNLNLTNKIFTSIIKLSGIVTYCGISLQHKLSISSELQQAAISIFGAELLTQCILHYPNQINIKGNQCHIQILNQGNILIQANMAEKCIRIKSEEIFQDDQWKKLEFY